MDRKLPGLEALETRKSFATNRHSHTIIQSSNVQPIHYTDWAISDSVTKLQGNLFKIKVFVACFVNKHNVTDDITWILVLKYFTPVQVSWTYELYYSYVRNGD